MSTRHERRRKAAEQSRMFAGERIREAQARHGIKSGEAPLHSEFIAGGNEHDTGEIGRTPGQLPAASPFESSGPTVFRVISYDENNFSKTEFPEVDKLTNYIDKPGITWVQMMGLTDPEIVHIVGAIFNLPVLAQEDILAIWSRPKFEEYGDMLLSIARASRLSLEDSELRGQQISVIAAPNFVISFHENREDVFNAVEKRLAENSARMRRQGTGYLFYALLDTLVDRSLYLSEEIEDAISDLEDSMMTDESDCEITRVYDLKRIVVRLGRMANPMRDMVRVLAHYDHPLLPDSLSIYFRDLHDHALRAGDRVEHARIILQELQEYHHTFQERKTSDIMRVLTVMSSIFIPLTFIAGVYGMNFKQNMPELESEYGYPICIGVMMLFAGGTFLFFRRKKWI